MGKFVFSLASLLDLREKIERQKEMAYGEAFAQLEREKEKLRKLENTKNRLLLDFSDELKVEIQANIADRYNMYIERIKNEIIRQKRAVIAQEKVVEEKRKELVIAMQERKTMEKLEEKEKDVFKEEEKRKEQRMVDEVVSFRFNDESKEEQ